MNPSSPLFSRTAGSRAGFGLLLWFLIALTPAHAATGLDRLVRQVEGLFPPLQGYVLKVKGSQVLIDLKQGQPVKPGDVLKLVRLGEEIIHPVTNKVIGREETDLGQVKIVDVRQDYSIAQVLESHKPPQQGDGIRSRFKTVTFLVPPVISKDPGADTESLAVKLERALNNHPRMEVPPFGLKAWMLENGLSLKELLQPANLARLKQAIPVDFLLVSKLETIKGKTALRYRVVSADDGSTWRDARLLLENQIVADPQVETPFGQGDVQTSFKKTPNLVEFVGKQEFDFVVVDFDIGDLDGDGQKEFVVIDRHRVLVYQYRDNQYHQVGQMSLEKEFNRLLAVDVADINGNGRDEIFVTNQKTDQLKSFVLERVPGKKGLTQIVEGLGLYFRVIRNAEGQPQLLAQRPGYQKPFSPGIQKFHHKKGEYTKTSEIRIDPVLDPDFTLYGFAQEDITFDKSLEIIVLDKNYKLRVYSSDGRLLVKSDDYYGHDPRLIDVGLVDYYDHILGIDINPDVPQPVNYRGRIVSVEHHGKRFLLIPKNNRFGGSALDKLISINSCNVVFLGVNKEGLEKIFETKNQKGYLAAFSVTDIKGTRSKLIHVATVADKGGAFRNEMVTTFFTYLWK